MTTQRVTSAGRATRLGPVLLAVALAVAGCSSSAHTAASTTTASTVPPSSTTTAIPPGMREKWARTANEWVTAAATSGVTQREADFMDKHANDMGPTTNAAQMLVFGYDLCEAYSTSGKSRDQVVQDWAAANPALASVAPALGDDASHLLCP